MADGAGFTPLMVIDEPQFGASDRIIRIGGSSTVVDCLLSQIEKEIRSTIGADADRVKAIGLSATPLSCMRSSGGACGWVQTIGDSTISVDGQSIHLSAFSHLTRCRCLMCGVGGKVLDAPLVTRHRALPVGIVRDQAGIDGKPFATHQAFGHAAAHHSPEHMAQEVALPEAAMAVERVGRVIRNLAIKT
jgi:hypothetical protein